MVVNMKKELNQKSSEKNIDIRMLVISKLIERYQLTAGENGIFYQSVIKLLMILHGGALIAVGALVGNLIGKADYLIVKKIILSTSFILSISMFSIGLVLAVISLLITQIFIDKVVDAEGKDINEIIFYEDQQKYLDIISKKFLWSERVNETCTLKIMSKLYNISIAINFFNVLIFLFSCWFLFYAIIGSYKGS